MRFSRIWATMLVATFCLLPAAMYAAEGAVDGAAVLRLGNSVELVGDGISDTGDELFQEIMGPPADDNHKLFITLFTSPGCAPCEKLKADLKTSPHLRALVNVDDHKASFAHFNVYDTSDKSQEWRWKSRGVTKFPTIVVQPPLNGRYGDPKTTIAFFPGYDGNPERLAKKIIAAVRKYTRTIQPRHSLEGIEQAAASGETLAAISNDRTPPWRPRPKDPNPNTPLVDPPPPPLLPGLEPYPAVPTIPAFPPLDEEPEFAPIPKAGQIVVITAGDEEESEVGVVQALAKRIKERRKLRIREIDFDEAQKTYPVAEDELPVVLVTSDGRIESKILGRLLDAIEPPAVTIEKPVEKIVEKLIPKRVEVSVPAEVESVADVPWGVLLQIFTGGLTVPSAIALAIWGFRMVRAYRKSQGQKLLIDDAVMNAVLEKAAPMLAAVVERIVTQLKPKDPPAAEPETKR